jgi:hypothetical protein
MNLYNIFEKMNYNKKLNVKENYKKWFYKITNTQINVPSPTADFEENKRIMDSATYPKLECVALVVSDFREHKTNNTTRKLDMFSRIEKMLLRMSS